MTEATNPIDKLIQRAGSLYTLPSVAMEVVRLTSQEDVDTREIKEAIEGDPALTAKVLRVVNSSMFGLSGEVANLTQALALLGVRPLKLLVLGFSLPDRLFANLAGQHLTSYWTTALTRSLAARAIAEEQSRSGPGAVNGDDAFVAALLRDIGHLVLLQEIGAPYIKFLDSLESPEENASADEPGDQQLLLERETLGFDHVELSVALMRSWKLPAALVDAVEQAQGKQPQASPLANAVAMAELVTQLVVRRRLSALPELLERGEAACGMSAASVNELVGSLQASVPALADALRAPIDGEVDFRQALVDAHAQMTLVAEAAAIGEDDEDDFSESLLAESHDLRLAMRKFLRDSAAGGEPKRVRSEAPHPAGASARAPELDGAARRRLEQAVAKLAERCRSGREDLSLAMLQVEGLSLDPNDRPAQRRLDAALAAAEESLNSGRAVKLTLGEKSIAVLMPGVDRRSAISFCQRLDQALGERSNQDDSPRATVQAGIASIVSVPNRFEPAGMIEGASRCLLAARGVAAGTVKSIEVY